MKTCIEGGPHGRFRVDGGPFRRFSKTQTRMLRTLIAAGGNTVTYDQILSSLYYDADEEPEGKILSTMMCHMRTLFREMGAPRALLTEWGVGFAVNAQDYEWVTSKSSLTLPLDQGVIDQLRDAAFDAGMSVEEFAEGALLSAIDDAHEY